MYLHSGSLNKQQAFRELRWDEFKLYFYFFVVYLGLILYPVQFQWFDDAKRLVGALNPNGLLHRYFYFDFGGIVVISFKPQVFLEQAFSYLLSGLHGNIDGRQLGIKQRKDPWPLQFKQDIDHHSWLKEKQS